MEKGQNKNNMAALCEAVPTAIEPSLFGIESGREEDTIIISNKKYFINTLKLSDQKLISSVPLRVGVKITSPAIWNEKKEEYLVLQNKQDVYSWKEGHTVLDKAKKRHVPTDVHKLFSIKNFEPVVVCENGTVGFLGGSIKEDCEKSVLSDSESITWCSAVELKHGICVVYTSTCEGQEGVTVHSHWYSSRHEQWKHATAALESHGELLSCACSLGPSKDSVRFLTLWKDGSLHEMLLRETSSVERGQLIAVRGVSASCSLFCLSNNYVALVGLQRQKQDGVGILDTKFGTVQAWQPFPEKLTADRKAFCQREHILVHCGKTLYLYRYECQVSTLASMIGQQQGAPVDVEYRPVDLLLSPKNRRQSTDSMELRDGQVEEILKNLADPLKTSSYTSFKRDFAQLKSSLPESGMWAYLRDLTAVLKRCCSERKFWPSEELEFLISHHCISSRNITMVFEALVRMKDVSLVYKALVSQMGELPESCLVMALQCFLSATDKVLDKAAEHCGLNTSDAEMMDMEDVREDADKAPCPFSKSRKTFVDQVLCCPFDDAYLLDSLRKLPFEAVLDLLKYILYTMKQPIKTVADAQTNNQLSRWEAITIDAHTTHLIMAKDAHQLLIEFSKEEDGIVSLICEQNKELKHRLKHIMTKNADKQSKTKGQYWIEVLHLF